MHMYSITRYPAEDIQSQPRNRAEVIDLVEMLRRRQGIIPFVGAGLSFGWGFPLWGQFLIETAKEVGIEVQIRSAVNRNDYELAAQEIESRMGRFRFNRLISARFGKTINPKDNLEAAVHLLPGLATGPVITTNFDSVLESIFRAAGRAFDLPPLWGAKSQLAMDGLAEDYSMLLKIHGDARHADERVLTLEEYKGHYGGLSAKAVGYEKPLPRLLLRLFTSRSVLFIGCSLGPDRTMAILARIAQSKDSPPHFALTEAPEKQDEFERRESFLRANGIRPIWYQRKAHHLLNSFLRFLLAQIPPRSIGYRGIPSQLRRAPLRKSIQRVRAVRVKVGEREGDREFLLEKWGHLSTADERLAFWDQYKGYLRDNHPRDLLKMVDQVVADVELEDPERAADYLIAKHLATRSLGEESSSALAVAAAILKRREPGLIHVDLLHTRALAAREEGKLSSAEEFSHQALRLASKINLSEEFALRSMWRLRAGILVGLGRYREARRYAARALRSARRERDRDSVAGLLLLISNIHFEQHQPRKMERATLWALEQVDEGDLSTRAAICANLGVALFEQGKYSRSLAAYREALWYGQQGDSDPGVLSNVLMNLAWLEYNAFYGVRVIDSSVPDAIRKAALRRSLDYYAQALALADTLPDKETRAHVLIQQALVLAALGDTSSALRDLRVAAKVFRKSKKTSYLATLLNNRGLIWEQIPGGISNALRAYASALQVARQGGYHGILQTILYNYALLLEAEGRYEEALAIAVDLNEFDKNHREVLTSHEALLERLQVKLKSS